MSSKDLTLEALNMVLKPCESISKDIEVNIPKFPQKVDVVFCLDLTGSMNDFLDKFKSQVMEIINILDELDTDVQYGLTSHVDYPNKYTSYGYSDIYGRTPDYAFKLSQPITDDREAFIAAVNALKIKYGGDSPECYTRAFYESYANENFGWRVGAKRLLVHFGDDIPHDNDVNVGVPGKSGVIITGGDPGRDEIMFTPDDLDLQTVLMEMKNNNVILIECRPSQSRYFEYWDYWTNLTGGSAIKFQYITFVKDVSEVIINTIKTPIINKLKLVIAPRYREWLVSVTPSYYCGVTEVNVKFNLRITAPKCVRNGKHYIKFYAVDDSKVIYGQYYLVIKVIGCKCNKDPFILGYK